MARGLLTVFIFLATSHSLANGLRCQESYIQICRPYANVSEYVCMGWENNNMGARTTTCSEGQNVCTIMNSTFSMNGMLDFDMVVTGCGEDVPIGCYDKDQMADQIDHFTDQMDTYAVSGLELKMMTFCACEEEICNSASNYMGNYVLYAIAWILTMWGN